MAELVHERYGNALFEVTKEAGCLDEVMAELNAVKFLVEENPEFIKLLTAKTISKVSQKEIIVKVFGEILSSYSENFLKLMVDNCRAEVLLKTIDKFKDEYLNFKGKIDVSVISAVKLSENHKEKLSIKLKSLIGKEPIITNIVDENILGGILLKINNEQIDNSVRGKLEDMKKQLLAVTM